MFAIAQQLANIVLKLPSRRLRMTFVRRVLGWPIGQDVWIGRAVRIQGLRGFACGDRVYIQRETYLDLRGGITVGSDVAISPWCRILTADHDPDSPTREYRERGVVIGDRTWLGSGACIMPGATVGQGTVVAAYAVAHGQLDDFGIYAGNPARRLRDRSRLAQARLAGTMGRYE